MKILSKNIYISCDFLPLALNGTSPSRDTDINDNSDIIIARLCYIYSYLFFTLFFILLSLYICPQFGR
jgi:hypothetical protein